MSATAQLTEDVRQAEDPRDCWRTPRPLFDALHRRFKFDIDAAADETNHLLPSYFTARDCGAQQLAAGFNAKLRAYVNCPYSDIAPWAEACFHRCAKHGSFSALLLPANRTQLAWFHDFALRGELWFFRGRIRFLPPPGLTESTPRGNNMLVVFDPATLDQGIHRSACPLTGALL